MQTYDSTDAAKTSKNSCLILSEFHMIISPCVCCHFFSGDEILLSSCVNWSINFRSLQLKKDIASS